MAAAIAAATAVFVVFFTIAVRGNDLEEVTKRNCEAINELVEQQNEAAANGRHVLEELLASDDKKRSEVEMERIRVFMDSLYYQLTPYECE